MKKGKKLIKILMMAMLLSIFMVGCGRKNEDGNSTESGMESPSQENSGSTGEDMGGSNAGDDMSGDGMNGDNSGTESKLTFLREAVVEVLGERYWPNMVMDAEMIESNFGISPDLYDDCFAEMPMIGTNVDTLLIVQAKEDKLEDVEKAVNAYRERLVNDSMQYPMNIGKVQASRIETIENYVCFIQLGGDAVDAIEEGEDKVLARCQEDNEKALDAIRSAIME